MPLTQFGKDDVQKWRKTFLALMKAVNQVKTYEDAKVVSEAVIKFALDFENAVYKGIVPYLKDTISDPDLAKSWEKQIRTEAWPLHIELLGFQLTPLDDYFTKDMVLERWLDKRKTQVGRAKRASLRAWKVLNSYTEHITKPTIRRIPKQQDSVMGFSVTWIGDFDRERAQGFVEGLKIYKERAKRVMPLLLRHKMPIMAYLQEYHGGRYEQRYIEVDLGWKSTPKEYARIIAHEHGHHVWQKYLSTADQKYWSTAVRSSYKPLKLSEIIKKWPDSVADDSLYRLGEFMHDKDPIFALQLDTITYGYGGQEIDFRSREDAEEILAKEGDKVYHVPKFPISAYANKNTEEAFCEALAHFVVYGPRAVHGVVRMWLNNILPGALTMAKKVEAGVPPKNKNSGFYGVMRRTGRYPQDMAQTMFRYMTEQLMPVLRTNNQRDIGEFLDSQLIEKVAQKGAKAWPFDKDNLVIWRDQWGKNGDFEWAAQTADNIVNKFKREILDAWKRYNDLGMTTSTFASLKVGQKRHVKSQAQTLRDRLIRFFKENPSPQDDAVHKFAEALGMEHSALESAIYKLLGEYINKQ